MVLADLEAAEESLMTVNNTKAHCKFFKLIYYISNKLFFITDHDDQLNMHGVFLHVLSDAIGSVIVIATALVSWLVPGLLWLKLYMDPFLRFYNLLFNFSL